MPSKFVHLQKLAKGWTHYIARSFDPPVGDLDPKTGQPWKKYEGICIISVRKRRGLIQALVSVPPQGLSVMRHSIAGQLNLETLHGIAWDEKTRTKRRINIPLKAASTLRKKKPMTAIDQEVSAALFKQQVDKAIAQFMQQPETGLELHILKRNCGAQQYSPLELLKSKPGDEDPVRALVGAALAQRRSPAA